MFIPTCSCPTLRQALALRGTLLGSLPLHVERSTTAMHHIVASLLPKTPEDQQR